MHVDDFLRKIGLIGAPRTQSVFISLAVKAAMIPAISFNVESLQASRKVGRAVVKAI
ncbi:hypothetical protein [Mesorhizobium amorphae]